VYVKFGSRHGYLTVHRTAGWAAPDDFGPEVLFGITVGNAMPSNDVPTILLLKTAYGGRSLAVDFRPPSAGMGNYTEVTNSSWYGWQYRAMMAEIRASLANVTTDMPGYNATMFGGYELCGFVWFQGWNDVIDWAKVREYESNLWHFVRDVRRDLHAPNLPFGTTVSFSGILENLVDSLIWFSDFFFQCLFLANQVVGELGMMGYSSREFPADQAVTLRAAQRQACAASSATKFVPTVQFAVLNSTKYDGIHHYYGRADTIFHIGKALGEGMLELLAGQCDSANSSKVWINEFHYDNTGTDTNEFIEIAHTISLTGCQLQFYRAGSILYNNISLTGTVPNSTVDSIQYTIVESKSAEGIDNGSPSGFALTDSNNKVFEFLSYEGSLMNASGVNSTDVGVTEDEATPSSHSLQKCPDSNGWTGPIPNTKGQPNPKCAPTSIPTPTPISPSPRPALAPTKAPVVRSCGIFGFSLFCFWSSACGWLERFFSLKGCSLASF
jgi:Carbohydrate esterase, sialic acid-specific acetylesterase